MSLVQELRQRLGADIYLRDSKVALWLYVQDLMYDGKFEVADFVRWLDAHSHVLDIRKR
jgi:hypothetical protein